MNAFGILSNALQHAHQMLYEFAQLVVTIAAALFMA